MMSNQYIRDDFRARGRGAIFLLLIGMGVFIFSSMDTTKVASKQIVQQPPDGPNSIPFVEFNNQVDDKNIQVAIAEALRTKPVNVLIGTHFSVIGYQQAGDWVLITLASLDGPESSRETVGS